MKVVSLFDGISCAYIALQKAGIPITTYTAYEIDKHAIATSKRNHPTIQHNGDVKTLTESIECDLLIGGSPCIDLSVAKKDRKGLDGEFSGLFWEYLRIKNLLKPKWFILENVYSMRNSDRDIITKAIGVEPILFDASLVSAQRRKRYFWTNIPITLPTDKGILLKHILETDVAEKYYINQTKEQLKAKGNSQAFRVYTTEGKSVCLGANGGGLGAKTGLYICNDRVRKLTPTECERLQGLPDGYTAGISDTQRYKCCGNAFNCDVVACILSDIPT